MSAPRERLIEATDALIAASQLGNPIQVAKAQHRWDAALASLEGRMNAELVAVRERETRLRRMAECEHLVDHDADDGVTGFRWEFVEHEGRTWNRCKTCGLLELWEGGMLVRADAGPALAALVVSSQPGAAEEAPAAKDAALRADAEACTCRNFGPHELRERDPQCPVHGGPHG